MRIVLNNQEFFVFKNIIYRKSQYYYNNADTTLADKFFSTSLYRVNTDSIKILELLSSSTKITTLHSKPEVVQVGYISQMEELQTFLKENFEIEMDYDFNFYAWSTRNSKNKNKKSLFKNYNKKIKIFFSWQQVLSLYNDHSGIGTYDFNSTKTIDDQAKTEFLKKKRLKINNLTNNIKKYVYLNLKKKKSTKNGKRGFFIESDKLVRIPS